MPTMRNAVRATAARLAVERHHKVQGRGPWPAIKGDQEAAIADLMSDCLHLAKSLGMGPYALHKRALSNFDAEDA